MPALSRTLLTHAHCPSRPCPQVTVDRPDVQGRVSILKVHARGKVLSKVRTPQFY